MNEVAFEAARALAARTRFVTCSTIDENGGPDTRLLFNLSRMRKKALTEGPARCERPFMTLLGTNTSSRKIAHIRRDNRVCLYYADQKTFEGLSVKGRLEEVLDAGIRRAVWTPAWEMYYYGGLDGGDFSLLRFIPEQARYYHGLQCHDFKL